MKERFCTSCGEKINFESKFCPFCGAKVIGIPSETKTDEKEESIPVEENITESVSNVDNTVDTSIEETNQDSSTEKEEVKEEKRDKNTPPEIPAASKKEDPKEENEGPKIFESVGKNLDSLVGGLGKSAESFAKDHGVNKEKVTDTLNKGKEKISESIDKEKVADTLNKGKAKIGETLEKQKEKASKNKEERKAKNKKILKIGIGCVAAIVVIFVLSALISAIRQTTAKPLDLNREVTCNSMKVKYPENWTTEKDSSLSGFDECYTIEIDEDSTGLVAAQYLNVNIEDSSSAMKEYVSTFVESAELENCETEKSTTSGHPSYIVKGTTSIDNKDYQTEYLLVFVDNNVDLVMGTFKKNNYSYIKTIEAMFENTKVGKGKEVIATFKDGDTELDTVKSQNYGVGAVIKTPKVDKKDGYVFDGWELEKEDSSISIDSSSAGIYKVGPVKSDITLKAVWKKEYKVTFVDGNGNTLSEQTVMEGKSATAPSSPTRDKYEFDGWDKDFSKITEDTTVTAKWIHIWTVTFVDGTGNTLKTQEVKDGQAASAPSDPSRSDYDFAGWDKDYSKITADTTVTAKWEAKPTISQKNAVKKANSYLSFEAFSRSGLIDQLEFEGFSTEDATYGVDHTGADWNEQAAKKAKEYLDFMAFSRDGLIEQLEFEGFSEEQAVYGVNSVGL